MTERRTDRWRPDTTPAGRMTVLTLTALVVGGLASVTAIAFVEAVHALNLALLISPRTRVQYEDSPGLVRAATIAVPTLGGLIVGLTIRYLSPERRPLGPADAIGAVQLRGPMPDARSGVISTVTAAISLGAGASVGQYGPMVYLGALIGGIVARLRLKTPNLASIAIACGVAAAISTAFNAPIAGLVFAHEVVLRHYSTQAFAPVTVASATGFVIDNVVFDRPPLFLVQFEGVENGHEFLLFALLGLAAAAVAIAFMRLLLWLTDLAERSRLPAAIRPAVAGLGLGLTALWLPDVLGIGWEAQRFATIEGAFGAGELVMLVVAKLVLTAFCLGFGFSGGVFSPSLLIGALLGALVWTIIDSIAAVPTSGVAVYALAGMMAVASPVIGAPLTCILIVFELTRNYDIAIAAMVAVVFSNLLAHRVFGRSFFDVQLARRGVDLSMGRAAARLSTTPALNCATSEFISANTTEPLETAVKALAASSWNEAFVSNPEGGFVGVLRGVAAIGSTTIGSAMSPPMARFDETTNVMDAMRALAGFTGDAVPVVHSKSGELLGVVTEARLIAAYLEVSSSLREEENASL